MNHEHAVDSVVSFSRQRPIDFEIKPKRPPNRLQQRCYLSSVLCVRLVILNV
jgi:hypothetical protein